MVWSIEITPQVTTKEYGVYLGNTKPYNPEMHRHYYNNLLEEYQK